MKNTVLINFTKEYPTNSEELISSKSFRKFFDRFIEFLTEENPALHEWITSKEDYKANLLRLLKLLLVLDVNEIESPYLENREFMTEVVELAYNFWRSKQRYSIIDTKREAGLQPANFIEADTNFNRLIRDFYRTIQQKVQGENNKIYRQLQAGTNASILLREYKWDIFPEYEELKKVRFIHTMLLRTPLIIHPKSNKRLGTFTETKAHPIYDYKYQKESWMCYPCKVGNYLTFIYFHVDFTSSVVGLSNLFELASEEDCAGKKPDLMILFGIEDGKTDTTYYHDKKNKLWVGKVSHQEVAEYFGYLKKMSLTLHNLKAMEDGYLPIHGAMINLYLKDGSKKGLVLMGDSGAGKSETIEAISKVAKGEIIRQEIIFDDMGIFKIKDGKVVAVGSEIGAFVRLDDLDKGTAYRDLDRSVFFNPESSNARVVIPVAPYHLIVKEHKVDAFLYANNYTDRRGIRIVESLEEAKEIFIEGKRFALGTTQETGLSKTYFANPFGPMQSQEVCNPIIEEVFNKLFETNILVGEVYTCLGLEDKGEDGIIESSKILFDKIKEI